MHICDFLFALMHDIFVTFYQQFIFSYKVQGLMEFLQKMPDETVLQEYGICEGSASTEYPFQLEGCISSCAHGQGRSATDRQFFYVNSRPCEPTKVKPTIFVLLYLI